MDQKSTGKQSPALWVHCEWEMGIEVIGELEQGVMEEYLETMVIQNQPCFGVAWWKV